MHTLVSYSNACLLGQHIRPSTSCIFVPCPAVFLFSSSWCLRCLTPAAAFFRCLCAGTEWPGYMALLCQRTLCQVCNVRREDTEMSNTCVRVLCTVESYCALGRTVLVARVVELFLLV